MTKKFIIPKYIATFENGETFLIVASSLDKANEKIKNMLDRVKKFKKKYPKTITIISLKKYDGNISGIFI